MAKALVIVESPTKNKTLKKFLGSSFDIEASVGHIRDLPEKGFGVDLDKLKGGKVKPEYVNIQEGKNLATIKKLKQKAKGADVVYLATDPDREGEAIAWHIEQVLKEKGSKPSKFKRITFNAITKKAVLDALDSPRKIDNDLVNAQQARRILDRIVGFKLSPIVNNKVIRRTKGVKSISAGRVQSVALMLVVLREKEIEAFNPEEYWNINPLLESKDKKTFESSLTKLDGKKVVKPQDKKGKTTVVVSSKSEASKIVTKLKKAKFTVGAVEKKKKQRHPVPPFITSTLQQEASRHFRFDAQRTMRIAQSLYEGVDLGNGETQGLITYMRTDSVRISPEGLKEARDLIKKKYGAKNLPDSPRVFKGKKSSQDAHEAIRPANVSLDLAPDKIARSLSDDQRKLYGLIWNRFIASQMIPAVYDTIGCDIETDQKITLRTTGSILRVKGFLEVYEEMRDTDVDENADRSLPDLKEGQTLKLKKVDPSQSFTQPPPRFTEATLVKALENSGIGRPSTYATIMQKIQSREYTEKEGRALKPTPLGMATENFLETYFPMIMEVGFTAKMEVALDGIETGEGDWEKLLSGFYNQFEPEVEKAVEDSQVPKIETDIQCPQCKKAKLQKTWSKDKRKYFLGCANYPDCSYTVDEAVQNIDKSEYADDFDWDQKCSKCSSEMKLRHGRFGFFLGCTNYPKCNTIVNIPKKGEDPAPENPDIPCPAKDCTGHIVTKKSFRGTYFYACDTYPECDVAGSDLKEIKAMKGKERKKVVKRKRKGRNYIYKPNKALADVIGPEEKTKPEIRAALWAYIKKNELQDKSDGRLVNPDKKLAKVFDEGQTHMFKFDHYFSKHLE